MPIFTCAKDCPGRKPGCHGTCEKYKREAAENQRRLDAEKKRRQENAYEVDTFMKKLNFKAKERKRRPKI